MSIANNMQHYVDQYELSKGQFKINGSKRCPHYTNGEASIYQYGNEYTSSKEVYVLFKGTSDISCFPFNNSTNHIISGEFTGCFLQ